MIIRFLAVQFSGQAAVPVTTPAQTVLLAYVADQIPNLVAVNATGISVAPDGVSANVTLLFYIGATPQQYTANVSCFWGRVPAVARDHLPGPAIHVALPCAEVAQQAIPEQHLQVFRQNIEQPGLRPA